MPASRTRRTARLRVNPRETPAGFVPRYATDHPTGRLLRPREVRGFADVELALAGEPALVGSADGAIERLLFTVPAFAFRARQYWRAYEDLWAKLPETTALLVLAHAEVAPGVERRLKRAGLDSRTTVLAAPDEVNFSIWAEDAYLFVWDRDGRGFFVEPFAFRRRGDALVADLVTRGSRLGMYQAPLYFQGGNVLVGDDFFLIGRDYVIETLEEGVLAVDPGASERTRQRVLFEAYRRYLDRNRRPMIVGSRLPVAAESARVIRVEGRRWTEVTGLGNREGTVQPLFHIDMFITPAGREPNGDYVLLVGDSRSGAEVAGVPLGPAAMPEVFDDIADQLDALGFRVVRNPLPLVYVDDPAGRTRQWYFATSNNALVQVAGSDRRVWLPTYGHAPWPELKRTDEANRRIWEGIGFEVHPLADFHPFAQGLGAVHCIKKYLARGPTRG